MRFRGEAPTTAGVLLLLVSFVVAGCRDEGVAVGRDQPPEACFSMFVNHGSPPRQHEIWCKLDPTCSTDDRTPDYQLVAQWDFEGDGEWDTEYEVLKEAWTWPTECLPGPIWTVRCRVRDAAGNVSVVADSVDISTTTPSPPDLLYGDIRFSRTGSCGYTNVVTVGEWVEVVFWYSAWMECSDDSFAVAIHCDWRPPALARQSLAREAHAASLWMEPVAFDAPGDYRVEGILDPDDEYAETNESNNIVSRVLTVVAGPHPGDVRPSPLQGAP